MTDLSFAKLATISATTKRPPAVTSGQRGAPVAYLTDAFACTPLDPVTSEISMDVGLDTPHEVLQTTVDAALDIKEGDVLVVGSDEYWIRATEDWSWRSSVYRRLFVNQRKQTD
jgi:hypothetical protein